MIERLDAVIAALAVGIDNSLHAVKCAVDNLQFAGHSGSANILTGDISAVPIPSASFEELVADLPYGMLVETDGGVERVRCAARRHAPRCTRSLVRRHNHQKDTLRVGAGRV